MRKILILIALVAIAATVPSCSTDGCTELRSAIPYAEFRSAMTGKSLTLDSLQIHGIGAPGDSAILEAGKAASGTYLPFRPATDRTSWCIAYKWKALDHTAVNDTVTFSYEARPWFASEECGAMYRYRITDVTYTRHILDSVAVVEPDITNIDMAQLYFYFRTEE